MERDFKRDPLGWLEDAALDARGVRWVTSKAILVHDARLARSLLRNDDDRLIEHSDFFGDDANAPSRRIQIALARDAFAVAQRHVAGLDCGSFVTSLPAQSIWPAAGNSLLLALTQQLLAAPRRSPALHRALASIIQSRILGRQRRRSGLVRRIRERARFKRALLAEVKRDSLTKAPVDDLVGVFANYLDELSDEAIVHVYAGFVFALVGSIGFELGWAVLQACLSRKFEHHPAHLVLEAMRLYPVAWLFERRLRQSGMIQGDHVAASHSIMISPYATHRNPVYWRDPSSFRPDRWSSDADRSAFFPFGAGQHGCVAAGFSVRLASRLLEAIIERDPRVRLVDDSPGIGAALAAPTFLLNLRTV